MDEDLLKRSLQNLEEELQKLDEQLKTLHKLNDRRAAIYGLVTQMRFTLGLGPYKAPEPAPSEEPKPDPPPPATPKYRATTVAGILRDIDEFSKPPIWECARRILSQAERPMTLDEIVEALTGFNFKLVGRSGRETVRAILYKKADIFKRLAGGMYDLKG